MPVIVPHHRHHCCHVSLLMCEGERERTHMMIAVVYGLCKKMKHKSRGTIVRMISSTDGWLIDSFSAS